MTDELEDLRARTEQGDRLDEVDSEQSRNDLVEELVAALEEIENGEKAKTVSVWDAPMAALITVLETRDGLCEDLTEDLASELEIETPDAERSSVLKMALRLGFREANEDLMTALQDALRERATQTL